MQPCDEPPVFNSRPRRDNLAVCPKLLEELNERTQSFTR